jgi:hypothetical protein
VKIHEKLLASIRQQSPYLAWAQQGLTPDEVKARILAILQPHFQNPSVLTEVPIEALGHEAVAIGHIQADPWSASMLAGVLSEYRAALAEDQRKSIEAVEDWDEQIERSTSEFFSLYVMEVDKAELQLDELRLEVLRSVGGLVEACIQPHLKALLSQVRIRRRRKAEIAALLSLKLGEAVEELHQTLLVPTLVAPPPWNLKLHVWRNVAQHHSAKIQNGRIVCDYKVGRDRHQIELTRENFIRVARTIQQVLSIVRVARTIFVYDNAAKLKDLHPNELRSEISFFEFAVGIATQGFDVLGIEVSDDAVHLRVQDVTDGDARRRGVHASQFLVGTWMHFRKPVVRVTYIDRGGLRGLTAEVTGSDCEDIADDRVPFETLASRVRFSVFDQRPTHAPRVHPISNQ